MMSDKITVLDKNTPKYVLVSDFIWWIRQKAVSAKTVVIVVVVVILLEDMSSMKNYHVNHCLMVCPGQIFIYQYYAWQHVFEALYQFTYRMPSTPRGVIQGNH